MNRYEHLSDRDFLIMFFVNEHDAYYAEDYDLEVESLNMISTLQKELNRRFSQEQLMNLGEWSVSTKASSMDMINVARGDYGVIARVMTAGA